MIIGTVREIKEDEYRVGLTPGGLPSERPMMTLTSGITCVAAARTHGMKYSPLKL